MSLMSPEEARKAQATHNAKCRQMRANQLVTAAIEQGRSEVYVPAREPELANTFANAGYSLATTFTGWTVRW